MRQRLLIAAFGFAVFAALLHCVSGAPAPEPKAPAKLCVVWSSGDPDVAKNVCFMYTRAAKKAGWFDVVHLVVWGPSAKLLAGDDGLKRELASMQQVGVVTEACVACAANYGVVDALKALAIDVKGMGAPLSERLKGDWRVITF